MRVLVVEDEQKVANALREGLEGERYDVAVERTGEDAFFRMTTEAFDVILLDLGLPGRDGLQILTTLRSKGVKTPVLILTARDTLEDPGLGLPGRDGLQILTTLRSKGVKTPVLILTARDTLEDRVAGLDSGADDYL